MRVVCSQWPTRFKPIIKRSSVVANLVFCKVMTSPSIIFKIEKIIEFYPLELNCYKFFHLVGNASILNFIVKWTGWKTSYPIGETVFSIFVSLFPLLNRFGLFWVKVETSHHQSH